MANKRKVPPRSKTVRRLARQRLGPAKPARVIEPKTSRRKPKHKRPLLEETEQN